MHRNFEVFKWVCTTLTSKNTGILPCISLASPKQKKSRFYEN
jgi:hypothetical protein